MICAGNRVRELAEQLIGSCDTDPDELENFSADELAEFDTIVFRCTGCGWWCSADECNDNQLDEWVCDDCLAEEDGDV